MIDRPPFLSSRHNIWVCLLLIVAILTVYLGVINHDFISFDDTVYVTENRKVRFGLTQESLTWAFNFAEKGGNYWQPLTWLSHMLDVEFYGLDPRRHHLTNVFFHIASAILLFLSLNRMTGARWRCAFVAALFALHPINVESVAWIAERKNVLSSFFWMLTLLAYSYYDERPGRGRYFTVLFVFFLGLLAKPMLVTLPFVLLLLDYWPLGRKNRQGPNNVSARSLYHLIIEKIPLFALSGLSVYLASSSLSGVGSYLSLESIPMTLRIGNAFVSYIKYIGKMIWPAQLAIFYSYPYAVPVWQITGALIFLVAVSIFVLFMLRRHAYLAVGWFWFIGTLIPVSGLVQAGLWPAMADRWAYVPLIGLFIMVAWGAEEIVNHWRPLRIPVVCAALSILMILIIVARIQVGYWANSITIFEHAITATGGSWVAHNNLGKALTESGSVTEAFHHYSAALRHNPNSAHIHVNFGSALLAQGKIDEAADHFEHALKLDPDFTEAYNNLGLAYVRRGNIDNAVYLFRSALQKQPDHANANQNLKLALSIQQKINRAARRMQQALKINPAESGLGLKMVELSKRKRDLMEAVNQFQMALARQPGFVQLEAENISAVSGVMKEYERLLPLFFKINEIQPGSADTSYHIACIFSRKGMVEESIKWRNKAFAKNPSRREFYLADPDLENMNP